MDSHAINPLITCLCGESSVPPDDRGMEYLSEWRLRMAPMLGTFAPPSIDGTWGMAAMGVMGAVGVVGV
ncbi:hypothetical protein EYF80_016037 [Liparis tanakae]|uniref:Uncharacterized protein n=1 Tax=Liparis tanakae TaxID=230148 RepID=A0A4Z2I6I8_9TELE|nr:hypothetical protein EYF80_016037 [Liparis tanakae]